VHGLPGQKYSLDVLCRPPHGQSREVLNLSASLFGTVQFKTDLIRPNASPINYYWRTIILFLWFLLAYRFSDLLFFTEVLPLFGCTLGCVFTFSACFSRSVSKSMKMDPTQDTACEQCLVSLKV